jgi:hypothetical protein
MPSFRTVWNSIQQHLPNSNAQKDCAEKRARAVATR